MRLNINKKIFFIILFFLFFIVINNKCFSYTEADYSSLNYDMSDSGSHRVLSLLNSYHYNVSDFTNFFYYKTTDNKYYFCFLNNNSRVSTTMSGNTLTLNFSYTIFIEFSGSSKTFGPESATFTITNNGNCSCYFSTMELIGNSTYFYNKLGNISNGILSSSQIVYETPTLYIDDMNFRKRFSFQFNIPMIREDTKYYVFLEDYNRISYSSVSATFRIFTVTTPEGYDYTDYENYMYYDKRLKNHDLVLPAGCEVHEYSTICNNDSISELNEIQTYITSRIHTVYSVIVNLQKLMAFTYDTFNEETFSSFYTYLYPTDFYFYDNISYNFSSFIVQLLNTFTLDTIFNTSEEIFSNYFNNVSIKNAHDYYYYSAIFIHYYSDIESYNLSNFMFSDFCFSNGSIVSYEPKHYDSDFFGYYYNIFRKTTIYNKNNMISNNSYVFNYSDGEDVSSMLPSGTSVDYLTSPFYKDNENSSSGGYITYDVNEILQGDKIIDYSKEDNSIHNNFNGDYIENFQEGDNVVINNYYTNTVDKTSDSNLLHNIYITLLQIRTILDGMEDNISNTFNNFNYNTENKINYYMKPNSYNYDYYHNRIKNTFRDRLSFIYDPFICIRYFFTGLSGIVIGDEDIILDIPSVSWQEVQIIPHTTFNFTTYMEEDVPILNTIHNYYLTFIDFVCVGFLANLAYKKWKELTEK